MAEKTVKAKVENYTAEQTAAMIERYKADPTADTVAALANELGKTVRSVIAKLTREKVYVAKTYKTKAGEEPQSKEVIADAIGRVLGLSDGETDSLAKANKTALQKVFAALANSKPI